MATPYDIIGSLRGMRRCVLHFSAFHSTGGAEDVMGVGSRGATGARPPPPLFVTTKARKSPGSLIIMHPRTTQMERRCVGYNSYGIYGG